MHPQIEQDDQAEPNHDKCVRLDALRNPDHLAVSILAPASMRQGSIQDVLAKQNCVSVHSARSGTVKIAFP